MASHEQNMNDLMQAAQLKLEAQKKQQAAADAGEDIYASMRAEMESPEYDVPSTPYIQRQQEYEEMFNIEHDQENIEQYYIDPNDTPIFEGGPGISQIDIWKKQFTKEKIFHTQILDRHFVFRTLNRFEYKQIVGVENIDALYREEIICTTCVLWPRNYDFKAMAGEDGGYPSTLAQIIMENSGFTKEYGIEVL
jgi:hypothetical protein